MSVATVWAHLPALGSGVLLADPAPSPSPTTQVPDDLEVTPGLAGFLATFAVAVACVLLFLSLTRHLRRAQHNAEEQGLPVDRRRTVGRRPDGEPEDGEPEGGGTEDGRAAPGDADAGPADPWPGEDPPQGPDAGGRG